MLVGREGVWLEKSMHTLVPTTAALPQHARAGAGLEPSVAGVGVLGRSFNETAMRREKNKETMSRDSVQQLGLLGNTL